MLKLPKLLSDGCVLQQGDHCRIWGFAAPKERVTVTIGMTKECVTAALTAQKEEPETAAQGGVAAVCARDKTERNADVRTFADGIVSCAATSGADGRFEVMMQTPPAGGPYLLSVENESGEKITVRDVYVGDVFVCSGQSNIELPMCRVRVRFPEEFANGGAPDVRLYKVIEHFDFDAPLADHVSAGWTVCTSENLQDISALSYFIGKQLAKQRKIPIGILNLSLGGTPAEAWMSRDGLKDWPELLKLADIHRDKTYCRDLLAGKMQEERVWDHELRRQESESENAPFHAAVLPGTLESWGLKNFCGCLYLRKTFPVPEAFAGRRGLLRFGTLIDSDRISINGEQVGETGYRYPPRRYPIREGLLKAGENEITIRLICREGDGRITDNKPLDIIWEDVCSEEYAKKMQRSGMLGENGGTARQTAHGAGECFAEKQAQPDAIDLSGDWEYQVRAVCGPAPEQIFINRVPTGLFNGMVAPCLPFAVKGVVWYQGESNDRSPQTYEQLLRDLIADWRKHWQPDLPFVVVQLPNCDVDVAAGDAWPQIREAQRQAEVLPKVAVTVNLDLGEDNDLHPLDKKTAAERAVLALRAVVYGEAVEYRGPVLEQAQAEGADVRITYRCADGKLELTKHLGQSLKENPRLFELAGADGVYYPAEVRMAGSAGAQEPAGALSAMEQEPASAQPVMEQEPAGAQSAMEQKPAAVQSAMEQEPAEAQQTGTIRRNTIMLHSDRVREPRYVRYAWDRAPGATLLYDGRGLPASPFQCDLSGKCQRGGKQ